MIVGGVLFGKKIIFDPLKEFYNSLEDYFTIGKYC